MKTQDDIWAFPKTTSCPSYVIFRSPNTKKNAFPATVKLSFYKEHIVLITRVLETKLNQRIGLMDSRVPGGGRSGRQA